MIRLKNVDLEEGIIHGGMKTEAGRNRIVPIHPDLVPIVRKRYEASQSGFLFENDGRPFSDYQLRKLWAIAVKELHMEHIPHECRHTFRSRMDSAGANKVCIDRIMGHKSEGVGERIYTHKTIQELKKAVRMLPGRPGKGGDDLSC
jgi:integrase